MPLDGRHVDESSGAAFYYHAAGGFASWQRPWLGQAFNERTSDTHYYLPEDKQRVVAAEEGRAAAAEEAAAEATVAAAHRAQAGTEEGEEEPEEAVAPSPDLDDGASLLPVTIARASAREPFGIDLGTDENGRFVVCGATGGTPAAAAILGGWLRMGDRVLRINGVALHEGAELGSILGADAMVVTLEIVVPADGSDGRLPRAPPATDGGGASPARGPEAWGACF